MSATPTALCLLDFQVGLCSDGPHGRLPALAAEAARRGVVPRAAALLRRAREAGAYVVHVRLAFDPSFELRTNRSARFDAYQHDRAMLVGSPEAAFVKELNPLEREPIVTKGGVNPFIGTPLLEMLVGQGLRRVAFGGVATNLVVEAAIRHAVDSGLEPVLVEDICASFAADMHDFAVTRVLPMFAQVVASEELYRAAEDDAARRPLATGS